jgi:hypothetical protein
MRRRSVASRGQNHGHQDRWAPQPSDAPTPHGSVTVRPTEPSMQFG